MLCKRHLMVVLGLTVVATLFIAIVAKRDHLVFLLRGVSTRNPSVQIQPLEGERCPPSWTRRSAGRLTIKLPPDFAEEKHPKEGRAPFAVFTDREISVLVFLPTPLSARLSGGSSEWQACLARRGHDPIRVLADMYRADASQFRLGMTREEVRDLDCLLRHKAIVCSPSVQSGEEFHEAGISGLLLDRGETIEFDWCCFSAATTGSIVFEGTPPLDRALVRRVCASLQCLGQ